MRKKKDIPLNVLKALEPFVNLHGDLFVVVDPKDSLMKAIDKDSNSSFHYTIVTYKMEGEKYFFSVVYSPASDNNVGEKEATLNLVSLKPHFESWTNQLNNYNGVKSFYDDPILETYQAEFFSNFEFLDETANEQPFNTTQIIQLDYLLEQVSTRLVELSDNTNRDEIQDISNEISEIRENLPTSSQKWVVQQISKIFGKIAKQGVKFIKEFWAEGKKEFIKNVVKGLIESGTDLLN